MGNISLTVWNYHDKTILDSRGYFGKNIPNSSSLLPGGETMDTTSQEFIFSVINRETPESVDYQIAWYILEHIDELDSITLGELAARCNVSKSTVSRFCRHVGLEDFVELQLGIRHSRMNPQRKFWFNAPAPTAENFLPVFASTLTQMNETLDWELLHKLVDDIAAFPKVSAFGRMQSADTAFELQHNLYICGKLIQSTNIADYQAEIINNASADDLIVVFSSRGRFFESILRSCPRLLERRDLPRIYMITSSHIKPVPKYIHRVVEISRSLEYDKANILANTYAQLMAIDYCNRYCG